MKFPDILKFDIPVASNQFEWKKPNRFLQFFVMTIFVFPFGGSVQAPRRLFMPMIRAKKPPWQLNGPAGGDNKYSRRKHCKTRSAFFRRSGKKP